jgi:uncharacterized protein (TIGR02996 family)
MNEREALLAAVCANPDDDTPRLVFADWLEENGEPERAEFIRVQIELPACGPGKRRLHLSRRELELLNEHEEEWVEHLRPYMFEWSDKPWAFRRGFVERLELQAETFIEQGEELLALTPLRDAVFPDEEWYEELAGCRLLRLLRLIDLTGSGLTTGFRGIHDFLASPNLSSVETLILQGMDDNGHLDATGVETLAKNSHVVGLRHLDLSNNWFGPEGIRPLVEAVWLPQLRQLELEGVGIANQGVDWLAEATRFNELRVLNLVANSIGERGGRRILQTRWFDQLEVLDLRDHCGEQHIDDPLSEETVSHLRVRFGKRILI